MSFFFDEKPAATRPPLDHQNLRVSIFDRYLSGISAVCDLDLTPSPGQPHRACSRRSLLGNPQAASGESLSIQDQFGGTVATCKSGLSHGKWPKSRLPATTRRRKRKKSIHGLMDLSRFFPGTSFAFTISCADNLLPRDPAPVPKQRPGYLIRRLPTAVPTRSPAVLFLETKLTSATRAISPRRRRCSIRTIMRRISPAHLLRDFC